MLRADRKFSLPITYRRVGDQLHRINMMEPGGVEVTSVIVRNVSRFKIVEFGSGITITLGLSAINKIGKVIVRSRSITVTLRN